MIYRTAHRTTYRNLNQNLGTLSYRIGQLTNQIASERRINTPSDDPSGAANVLSTRSTMANINQYMSNVDVSNLWLTQSGTAVQSIKEILDEVYTKIEQGATDTNAAQRGIIATEIEQAFQTIVQFANSTKIGDSYAFSGQKISTQPFAAQVEIQKVTAACENSDKWTGKVLNYGDTAFNSRPDLPPHSQNFLVEVVQAGGVDSQYYTSDDTLATGLLNGTDYSLRFSALDEIYNDLKLNFQVGKEDSIPQTGLEAANNGISFTSTQTPININYVTGAADSTLNSAVASWDAASNTMTVVLNLSDAGSARATAANVVDAINAEAAAQAVDLQAAHTGASTGAGLVEAGSIGFNNPIEVSVKGDTVTVYLPHLEGGSAMTVTAGAVAAFLNNNPPTSTMFRTDVLTGGAQALEATPAAVDFQVGVPYTLARVEMNPRGTQNDLAWSVKNDTAFVGAAGNNLSVEYQVAYKDDNTLDDAPSELISYDANTGEISVNLAVSASIYNEVFVAVYNDPLSGAWMDQEKANELALDAATLTTANDVIAAVAAHPELSQIVKVDLADGSSGEGSLNTMDRRSFAEGYDQPAMFRVSQDGGQTWGPAMSFAASEYETGDMFYNDYLGHASLTTDLPGVGNDLVFTAKHLGTWGNDLRVQYKVAQTHPSDLSIEMGPESWNICVNLQTDAEGNVLTTANEIKDLINSHPLASQLLTADLANYHEGGNGKVRAMDCQSLSVDMPYQYNGSNIITDLGHATATVGFNYAAGEQSCPNLIFQAIEHGEIGNDIGVRYTTSADPSYYANSADANEAYQDFTSVRYEEVDGKTVVVVHLATVELPLCPDADKDPVGNEEWQKNWPSYSCSSARAVITTAGDVLNAVIDLNTKDPANAVVWPSMEQWPEGWVSTAKVGPTDGTIWLSGGDDTQHASQHGINLSFVPDGTAMQVGDIFEVQAGWYRGDDQDIDLNVASGTRSTVNVTGSKLFGANGEETNILDLLQNAIWALRNNQCDIIGDKLPAISQAIEDITTLETTLGAQQIRNQYITGNHEQAYYNSQTFLSQTEDADFSQLITDLKNAQTVYEAILGATGLTQNVSLLDYI